MMLTDYKRTKNKFIVIRPGSDHLSDKLGGSLCRVAKSKSYASCNHCGHSPSFMAFLSKVHEFIHEETSDKPKLMDVLQNNWPVHTLQKCHGLERRRKSKGTKGT